MEATSNASKSVVPNLAVSLSTALCIPTAIAPRGPRNGSIPKPDWPDKKYLATDANASSGHAWAKFETKSTNGYVN